MNSLSLSLSLSLLIDQGVREGVTTKKRREGIRLRGGVERGVKGNMRRGERLREGERGREREGE